MTPTDSPKGSPGDGATRRPSGGGGAIYRHPSHPSSHSPSFHDGVHDHAAEDELHNPEVAHEHSDVNVRAIIMSAVVLTGVAVVSHLVIVLLFGWLEQQAVASQPALSPVIRPATEMPATTTESPLFSPASGIPGPQLLTNEPMALQKQRDEEAKRLHAYGWVNEGAGIAHMPIEEAKKLIAERGLPFRAEAAAAPSLGTRLPAAGEATGGRVITVPLPEPPAGAPATPAAKPQGGH